MLTDKEERQLLALLEKQAIEDQESKYRKALSKMWQALTTLNIPVYAAKCIIDDLQDKLNYGIENLNVDELKLDTE